MTTYSTDIDHVVSVWSAYGHTFISDDENYVSCLECGAMYQLLARADDPTYGAYLANNGDEPQHCTHDTSMSHGYPGEREQHEGNADHNCNCIACDS